MWLDKNKSTSIALDVFKTMVRLRIVDPIVNPAEWTKWYGVVKRFARKFGR